MTTDNALAVIAHYWRNKPEAVLAFATHLMIQNPDDIQAIKKILRALV